MTDTDTGLELTAQLSALLGIGSRLDSMQDELRRANQLARQAGMLDPASTVVFDDTYCPNPTATFVMDLGGPAQGRLWDLRRVVIGGLTPSTAAVGAADVYVSAAGVSQVPGAISLVDWIDTAATLPLNAFYSAGDVGIRFPEHLFVVVRGGTAAQQYLAAARVVDRIDTPTNRSVESVGA